MRIVNPYFPRHHADSGVIRQLLGLSSKAKLPIEGMPARLIQGIEVWVMPLYPRLVKRKRHRVLARCTCGKILSAGRLHQHKCKEVAP